MAINQAAYNGRDNAISLQLTSDNAVITHTGLTRCQLLVGDTMLDSALTPSLFDMTNADRIILNLGGAGLAIGTYAAILYVFDGNGPNGVRWGEFTLTVST